MLWSDKTAREIEESRTEVRVQKFRQSPPSCPETSLVVSPWAPFGQQSGLKHGQGQPEGVASVSIPLSRLRKGTEKNKKVRW